ncbi:MAG TPA: DUF1573 domain-containing protein, partial [Bacteroidia bacterium]|nr:DUF1573 domain-containing protein [Bacteroidia bacterium]
MQVRTLFIHHLVAQYLHDDGIVRKTLSLAFSFLSFFLCAQSRDTANAPVITFDETTHDFGTVVQGTVVTHEFRFTNTGKTPLVITNVCGSAGSVVPSFTKEPVAPGKNGMVKVIFSTTGNLGMQDKTVTLTSNAKDNTVVLHIKGQVIFPEQPLLVEKVILRNALQKPVDEYGKPLNGQSQQWPGCFLDIDTVTTGEKISFAFILRNQGNSPVRIMDVTNDKYISSNDEYISASASKISVAPGDTVKISATLSTKRLGPERRSVIVSYFPDDTRTYTSLYLHVKGFVIDPSLPVLSLSENGPLHDTVTQ